MAGRFARSAEERNTTVTGEGFVGGSGAGDADDSGLSCSGFFLIGFCFCNSRTL